MEYLCNNYPGATEEQTQQALEDAGYSKLAERTMYYWVKETADILDYMKEIGKLK